MNCAKKCNVIHSFVGAELKLNALHGISCLKQTIWSQYALNISYVASAKCDKDNDLQNQRLTLLDS